MVLLVVDVSILQYSTCNSMGRIGSYVRGFRRFYKNLRFKNVCMMKLYLFAYDRERTRVLQLSPVHQHGTD